MNILKTSCLILVLGLSLAAGSVKSMPVNRPVNLASAAVKLGRLGAKNVADVSKALFVDSTKAYFEVLKANLLASNHPVLANHPYATVAGFVIACGLLGGVVGAVVDKVIEKVKERRIRKEIFEAWLRVYSEPVTKSR